MKKLLFLALTILTFDVLRAQTGSLLDHVPSDADQVVQINLASLGSKVDWMAMMKLAQGHKFGNNQPMNPADLSAFLNSGVDLHNGVVIAISREDTVKYTTILVHLTDSGKFAEMLRSHIKDLHPLHLEGSREHIVAKKGNVCGWNDHLAVFVVTKEPKTETPSSARQYGPQGRRCLAALRGNTTRPFTTDQLVRSSFADDADIHFWNRRGASLGDLSKLMGSNPAAAQLGGLAQMMGKAHQDPTISSLRFEQGKIVFKTLKLITPAERSYQQRLAGQGLSSEIEAAAPAGPLMAAVAIHYDMDVWGDTMRKIPAVAMVESKLKEKGLSLDDFIHALKGDFLALVYAPEKAMTDTGVNKKPVFYVLATIKDKAAFGKVATALKLSSADAAAADPSADTVRHGASMPSYSMKNDLVVMGGDRRQVNAFFSQPASGSNPATTLLADRANNNVFTLAVDMHTVVGFIKTLRMKNDSIKVKDQKMFDALGKLDRLTISSGALHDNGMESYMELRMTDQDKNSLASLIDIIATVSKKPDGSNQ